MVGLAILLLVVAGLPFFWAAHASWLVGQAPIALAVTAVNWLFAVLLLGLRKRAVRTSAQGWCGSALAIAAVWLVSAGEGATDERALPMTVAVIVHLVLCGLVFVALMGQEAQAAYPSPQDDRLEEELASSKGPTAPPADRRLPLAIGAVTALALLLGGAYWFGFRGTPTAMLTIGAELAGQPVEQGEVFISGALSPDCHILPCRVEVLASREIQITVVAGDAHGEVTMRVTEDQQVTVKLASSAPDTGI